MSLTGQIVRKTLPKSAADRLASTVHSYKNYRRLRRDLADLRRQAATCRSLDEKVELICNHKIFGAMQQPSEIMALLKILQQNPPKYVCEIGSASGGTLFLFCQVCFPEALIISVDLGLSRERCLIHARFAGRNQRVVCLRGDSRAPETIQQVQSVLRGRCLDLLFIDGDHTYAGVKADFFNYKPLVAKGGLIVFHDIVSDFRTRFGLMKPGAPYTGEVPVFWREIKEQRKTSEIIQDPEQDGFGIGIVHL